MRAPSHPFTQWLRSPSPPSTMMGLGAPPTHKPPLEEAYAVYLGLYAPIRPSSVLVGPLADFVEVLRQADKTRLYSDQEWLPFFSRFTGGDLDRARSLWDAYVCQ